MLSLFLNRLADLPRLPASTAANTRALELWSAALSGEASPACSSGGAEGAVAARAGHEEVDGRVSLLAAVVAWVVAALWRVLEIAGALYLSFRYFTGPSCWLLFGFLFYTEPVLRLPLLAYHLYIISPAGRRAVGTSRVPWLLRKFPLYWGQSTYFKGSALVKTAGLDPQRRYVFAGHPHGLLGNAFFLAFCTNQLGFEQLFPGIRLSIGVLSLNLQVSFCREICLLHGLCDVDKSTLLARLRQGPGSAVFLAVGGAAESLLTKPGCLDLVLKRRRGFVKVALEAGADLVPVLGFGENDQFDRIDLPPGSLMDLVQRGFKQATGFAMPLQDAITGCGILNMRRGPLPKPVALTTVVGAPIRLPPFEGDLRSEEGRAHVDRCHAMYLAALQQLYDAHKDKLAPNRKKDMRFVE